MISTSRSIVVERRLKMLFFLGSLAMLFVIITQVQNMFISFLLAFVGYYLLAPLVDFMERRGLNRIWATTIPFLIFLGIFSFLVAEFAPEAASQIQSIQSELPKYSQATKNVLNQIEEQYGSIFNNIYPVNLTERFNAKALSYGQSFLRQIPEYLSSSLTVLLMAPFLTFFFLLDGRTFIRRLFTLIPNHLFEFFLGLNHQISSQMGGFIRARLLESILIGLITWIGLLIIQFPHALILSIFAAVLNIIPYVGPIIGALPAFIIAVANGASSGEYFELFLVYLVGQIIDTAILVPFLVAKIVDLHPVTVVIAIIVGSQVLGILGMIICIPVVSTLKVTFTALYNHYTNNTA